MSLKAKVLSVAGDRVSLGFDDGQKLTLPAAAVEGSPKEGSEVSLVATAVGSEDAGRTALARHLLNELLRPDIHLS